MSKTTRLLRLWLLISKRKRFTVKQLASEFGVSYRTMLRDLNELSEMGVPLYSEPGKHGGYGVLSHDPVGQHSLLHHTPYGKIVYKGEVYIIGLEVRLPFTAIYSSETVVPKLWHMLEQQASKMKGLVQPLNRIGLSLTRQKQYVYIAGFEAHHLHFIPQQMVGIKVPTQHYAVYTHHGGWSRTAMDQTYFYIKEEIEQQGYCHNRNQFSLEWYGQQPVFDRNRFVDMFIPLTKKRD